MIGSRHAGRWSGVAAALAAIVAVALQVTWAPAATGPVPAASASINFTSATSNLTDGAAVHFTVTTTGAVTLNKVEAKICRSGFTSYSTTTFGYDGGSANAVRCVNQSGISTGSLGAGDYRVGPLAFSAVQTSGDVTFHAGTGTVNWLSTKGFAPPAPLTCDSTSGCDLVIDVGLTGDLVPDTFFIQPLTYGTGGGPTTTTTTTPGATTTTASGATTTTTAGATTTTAAGATTTTSAGATTTTSPTNADGSVTPSTVAPDGSVTVESTGWKASSSVAATLHSDPVSLGTLTADADGKVSGAFTVPAGTAAGAHTIELTGKDPDDADRTVSLALTVSDPPSSTTTVVVPGAGSSAGGPKLAFTGSGTRNLASIALFLIALGLFLLGRQERRRAADGR